MKQRARLVTKLESIGSLVSLMTLLAGCSGAPAPEPGEAAVEGTLEAVVVGNAERTAAHLEFFLEREDGVWLRLLFDRRADLRRARQYPAAVRAIGGGVAAIAAAVRDIVR